MAGPFLSDADLIARMRERDEAALRTLYERHAGWMSARLLRRCADRDVVADTLQDTFVSAWNGAARFRGDGEVAGWLWGIAVHRLISRVRACSARGSRLGPAPVSEQGTDVSAEENVLVAIEYSDVGSALARISPELRVVLQATVLDGLATREAARLLGIPQGTGQGLSDLPRSILRMTPHPRRLIDQTTLPIDPGPAHASTRTPTSR